MTPLQTRKVQQMIDHRQYASARQYLYTLKDDTDAKAMLADMAITYPETKIDKAAKGVNRTVFAVAVGFLGLLLLSLLLMVLK